MEYFLMRKDEVVTLCDINKEGQMIAYAKDYAKKELAPLKYAAYPDHIQRWWKGRQLAVRNKNVEEMLTAKGLNDTGEFLLKNLGLSLIDYYWMKPVNTNIKWADINLFKNDFKENILTSISDELTPNSSLGGELEKSWTIRQGARVLVKGNHGELSSESINEVIATELHKKQGYDNYTSYKLIKIKSKPYDWGCCSKAFTSEQFELISANGIITSEEKPKGISNFEHLISVAAKHGIDEEQFRKDLEYQIVTDYILSNTDRHMDNIGILRDADSLEYIRMAPIFDTGRAFAARSVVPYTDEEIDNIEVNSFERKESELLKLVRNKTVVSIDKLPEPRFIEEQYNKDSKISKNRINHIVRLYNKKVDRLL